MLMNQGPGTIVAVEISPAGEARFGPSLLGRVELPAGNALHLTPPREMPCRCDLRIRWSGGVVESRAGEDLCSPQRLISLSTPAN